MKLKEFEWALQEIKQFDKPKVKLEQYPTSAHLASRVIFNAENSYGDIEDKSVLDLGCGPCILGIAAQMFGSAYTMGIDIDIDALNIAQENIMEYEVEVDLIQANVKDLIRIGSGEENFNSGLFFCSNNNRKKAMMANVNKINDDDIKKKAEENNTDATLDNNKNKNDSETLWSKPINIINDNNNNNVVGVVDEQMLFDTVLMNPPFGTKPGNKGIDMIFLETGLKLVKVGGAVYSMHKSSTREHIQKKAIGWGCSINVLAQMKFDIGNMYKFHKKKSVDIEVDLIRLERRK